MQAIKLTTQNLNRNFLKRRSEFSRTNRIRLDLFSFAKNEIDEKKKGANDSFSFSNKAFEEKNEIQEKEQPKRQSKFITKKISLESQKTANDSSDLSDMEEESSEMSCEEEEEI